eukprot:TRINITY_DN37434_c0_g1_i1.p1 TRINITY_DN37434_c0_g1~~TRINITY_DN37434_c0_g1_i1.p1  ORF type:complete len:576 (-),score=134.73 TRINITY_DN37434_c0_g1_i1:43-1749(-)
MFFSLTPDQQKRLMAKCDPSGAQNPSSLVMRFMSNLLKDDAQQSHQSSHSYQPHQSHQPHQSYQSEQHVYRAHQGAVSVTRNKIFVGALPRDCQEKDLFEHFGWYGRVSKLQLRKGFGFVEFEREDTVRKILGDCDRHFIHGKQVDVKVHGQWGLPENAVLQQASVFCGGLRKEEHLRSEDLVKYFSAYGKVTDVHLQLYRGYAYINFASAAGAQSALWDFPNHQLQGKWVEVKPLMDKSAAAGGAGAGAIGKGGSGWKDSNSSGGGDDYYRDRGGDRKPPWQDWQERQGDSRGGDRDRDSAADGGRGGGAKASGRGSSGWSAGAKEEPHGVQTNQVFVASLPWGIAEREVRDYFEEYGRITEMYLKRDEGGQLKGWGYITFQSDKQAKAVLKDYDRHNLQGRRIECMACGRFGNPPSAQLEKDRIFVGGLPAYVTQEDLLTYFTRYGRVLKVELRTGFAFVTFGSGADVQLVLHAYSDHRLDGKWIEVKPMVKPDSAVAIHSGDKGASKHATFKGGSGGYAPQVGKGGKAGYHASHSDQRPSWNAPPAPQASKPFGGYGAGYRSRPY